MIVVTNEELEALGTEDVLEADDGDDFTGGDDDLDFYDIYSIVDAGKNFLLMGITW